MAEELQRVNPFQSLQKISDEFGVMAQREQPKQRPAPKPFVPTPDENEKSMAVIQGALGGLLNSPTTKRKPRV